VIAVDTGLLAYAANRYAPQHARAARVLEGLANGDVPWGLPWSVVHEFLQLATHPHAVARPLAPADAWAFVGQITAAAPVRMLGPTERHDNALVEVIAMLPAGAGLAPGFETAVILREHGLRELLTTDRGMERFPFLSLRNPLLADWSAAAAPARRYRMLRPRVT
jgi:toxin-antitoxin system PIN domain toxin